MWWDPVEYEYKVDLGPAGAGAVGCTRKSCSRSKHAGKLIPAGTVRWMSRDPGAGVTNFYCLRPGCLSKASVNNVLGEGLGRGEKGIPGQRAELEVARNIAGMSDLPEDVRDIAVELIEEINVTTSTKVYVNDPSSWNAELPKLDPSFSEDELVSMIPAPFRKKHAKALAVKEEEEDDEEEEEEEEKKKKKTTQPQRKWGRPHKAVTEKALAEEGGEEAAEEGKEVSTQPQRKRGRPRKAVAEKESGKAVAEEGGEEEAAEEDKEGATQPQRKQGRPRKAARK